jgi:predicted N-acetyltransferase YhbS
MLRLIFSLNDMREMRIEYLADNALKVPELARLHFEEWSYLRPGESLEQRIERLKLCCGRNTVPTVVVALKNDELMGSAMLIERDMETHPHLSPWLAGVYVKPRYRGKDIGRTLVKRIEDEAKSLGAPALYLYSPSTEGFYNLLGWTVLERCETSVLLSWLCQKDWTFNLYARDGEGACRPRRYSLS